VTTIFLDRDGVINRKPPEGDYVKSWREFEFLPGVFEALRALRQHGFRLIVVTNQRGISLGMFTEQDLDAIHSRMTEELRREGCTLDRIYYCPHAINSCDCRKPGTGMFLEAQRDFPDIHFPESVVIGDSVADMQAAERLGCKKVLIESGKADVVFLSEKINVRIDLSAPSLLQAVKGYLIEEHGESGRGK